MLVAVCALLGCACAEVCEFDKRVHSRPEPLRLASALERVHAPDVDACKARCCAHPDCDVVVHMPKEDGNAQCHLLHCGGSCTFEDDQKSAFTVYTKSGEHAPENKLRVEPMMMSTSTRTEEQRNSSDVCALPRVVGACRAFFPRFYFDADSGSCESFVYGGCGSNGNNFETQRECEETCGGRARADESDEGETASESKSVRTAPLREMSEDDFTELCRAPPLVGPCRAAFPRWFYNESSGLCQRFIYGGCNGNKNNHESEEHCSSACSGVKLLPSKKKLVPDQSDDYEAQCAVGPDSGPCRAAFPMFFFDAETQSCRTFLYGGCRGNGNRYGSESECVERCITQGAAEGRGSGRNRWTAAFFLFLTLAAVSFLLLTALIFITMRRHRSQPHRTLSIRSDKEELLPESERSSVDSLPLPESPTPSA